MKTINAKEIAAALTPSKVADVLEAAFRGEINTPVRHHHTIERESGERATLLLMPAWHENGAAGGSEYIGIKIVSVFPHNTKRSVPTIMGTYLLLSGVTGEVKATLDGPAITSWRTAAASALASRYLSRKDSKKMAMIGSGSLAPYLVKAHVAERPITEVVIWNREPGTAIALAERLRAFYKGERAVSATTDLERAVRAADIVSSATLAQEPLVRGEWLKEGAHIDLVGGFTPQMREADDAAIRRAMVFVDTRDGACKEAGDIVQPLTSGVIQMSDVKADLFDLCRAKHPGRTTAGDITLFKSVGTALEDLALASYVYDNNKA
ncbi:MAG: ornithine cyclodeaminase family protein [Rhodospirillaceae bacterium]|nr:ornithine cyclodeaminase family protein [Rhodospirillaceae bacterium]